MSEYAVSVQDADGEEVYVLICPEGATLAQIFEQITDKNGLIVVQPCVRLKTTPVRVVT